MKQEAILSIDPNQIDQLLHKQIDPQAKGKAKLVGKGLPASPGAAVGQVVFTVSVTRFSFLSFSCLGLWSLPSCERGGRALDWFRYRSFNAKTAKVKANYTHRSIHPSIQGRRSGGIQEKGDPYRARAFFP